MRRVSVLFLAFILFLFLFSELFVSETFAFYFQLQVDKLSIDVDQVPLQTILRKLSEHGIEIKIDPQINPRVSVHFEGRDLQKAIRSIIRPLNHVLIWKSIDGPVGRITRLSEIQIFEPGRKEMMKDLVNNANLLVQNDSEKGIRYVKNEILLTLKTGITLEAFTNLLNQIKGTVIDSYPELGIYRIRLTENSDIPAIMKQISANEGIAKVEPNYVYPISNPNPNNQSLQRIPDLTDSPGNPGSVTIAVLDTGWNELYDQAVSVKASLDIFHPEQSIVDPLGHGTQMVMLASGLIKPYGVETDQYYHNPIIPVRIFDENGYTSNFHVMKSIDFALKNGARVISLSWGSETKSDFLEYQLKLASVQNAVIVAAGGNEPTGKPVYPAAYESVIGVGALGPNGKVWEKSNYGDSIMFYAPGYASFPVGYKGDPGTYAGTSISTAFTASLFADYFSRNPDANRQDLFNVLNRK